MKTLKKTFLGILLCVATVAFSPVHATIITLQIDNAGTISSVGAGSPEAGLGWIIGDTLLMQLTFDDATADTDPTVGSGFYEDPNGFIRFINSRDNSSILYTGGLEIDVDDEEELEIESMDASASAMSTPIVDSDIDFDTNGTAFFTDPDTLTAIVGDLLANVFPNNETNDGGTEFWDGLNSVSGIDLDNSELPVTVTLVTAAIPEPTTIALLGLGFAGAGWSRRKRAQ